MAGKTVSRICSILQQFLVAAGRHRHHHHAAAPTLFAVSVNDTDLETSAECGLLSLVSCVLLGKHNKHGADCSLQSFHIPGPG